MFITGQKVTPKSDGEWFDFVTSETIDDDNPRYGAVYTVAATKMLGEPFPGQYIRLHEYPPDQWFSSAAFRPVVERPTNISVFTAMLDKALIPQDEQV